MAADGALPPLPANVRAVRFIPHGALLPHVSAVISHAGNGTVTRAACAGVPLLLLPGGRDQPQVAHGAAAAGIALVLEREQADATRVRSALRTLLDDARYRMRAHALARRAAHYDAAATAAQAIEALLASAADHRAIPAPLTHVECITACRERIPGDLAPFAVSFRQESPRSLADAYRGAHSQYWVTVQDGEVVAIDELYLP